jgi:hypothetical protein
VGNGGDVKDSLWSVILLAQVSFANIADIKQGNEKFK